MRGSAPATKTNDTGQTHAAEGEHMGWGKERVRATAVARLNAEDDDEHKDMLICVDKGNEKGEEEWTGGVNENTEICA